jgi:hypothetical protein
MWLPLFYWRTIIEQCWPGALKLRSNEGIRVTRGSYAIIFEKNPLPGGWVDKFMEIYAIIAGDRQFGYKRGKLSGLTSVREVPKTFFNCGGQCCRIISVLEKIFGILTR